MLKPRFSLVATGGTFDRFHKGHEALLDMAFNVSEKVIIGVTSDSMVKRENKVLNEIILPYTNRVDDVRNYLKKRGFLGREIIEQLNDIYGPSVLNGKVEAVVCTRETRAGALAINRERQKIGHSELAIVECSFVVSKDNYHISSTRIRQGEINRQGELIIDKTGSHHLLPENLRDLLNKPIDKLFESLDEAVRSTTQPIMIITIGDVVTSDLIKRGVVPDIGVFDNEVERKADHRLTEADVSVVNKAGTVGEPLISVFEQAVKNWFKTKKQTLIKVDGEEDLAVVPAILTAPLGSVIYYGQPAIAGNQAGVVRVLVTEEKKAWTVELLQKFR